MVDVTLIRAPRMLSRNAYTTPTCPPLGLAYVASSLQAAGFNVEAVDAVGEAVHKMIPIDGTSFLSQGLTLPEILDQISPTTKILGFSCMFSEEWPRVRMVIEAVKREFPKAKVIVGGEHITAMPEYVLQDCSAIDYCVLGEGEEVAVDLCRFLLGVGDFSDASAIDGIVYRYGDGVKRSKPRSRIKHIDEIPPPAWDLFPIENYLDHGLGFGVNRGRMMPLLATRGCPYQCTFCSSPNMWTTRWIARSPRLVFEEMRNYIHKYNSRSFDFYDLTAIIKREWIIEFSELIIQSGEEICWQLPTGTRSEAIDGEVARLLYKSGCRNLTYAPESGSPSELKRIKKKIKIERVKSSMRACVRNKLNVKANIIVGMPDQTWREILETLGFIFQMAIIGIHDISINLYCAYPGSELFNELRKRGEIPQVDDNYLYSLTYYTDLTRAKSYSAHVSSRALMIVRPLGLLLFYFTSYIFRPYRLLRIFINYLKGVQESRLEMAVSTFLKRKFTNLRQSKAFQLGKFLSLW